LGNLELCSSQDTVLYKLGYIDTLINKYEDMSNEKELDEYFKKVADQPFVQQMLYKTNFISESQLHLCTNVLGCEFQIRFPQDIEMLLSAETILAYIESFFATSMLELIPHTEIINISLRKGNCGFTYVYNELSFEYDVSISNFEITTNNRESLAKSMMGFIIDLVVTHFYAEDLEQHMKTIFKKEEVQERLFLIIEHRNFMFNLFGSSSKLFFQDWIKAFKPKEYILKRKNPISYCSKNKNAQNTIKNLDEISHNKFKMYSVIDVPLWDKAKWKGFGFIIHPEYGLGVMLPFENPDAGKMIFDKWVARFGNVDKSESIKITIIKGINKNNPYWYRVIISTNTDNLNSTQSHKLIGSITRHQEMQAETPQNLEHLIKLFNAQKKYILYPAKISSDFRNIEPFFDKGIVKTTLSIKEAWQIGENDIERIAIKASDTPIIPSGEKDAPILKIIKNI
jgi:hypothetical protein